MFDYYSHVNSLTEDKLIEEIQKLTKRLYAARPGTPAYTQLTTMLDQANEAYTDCMYRARFKTEAEESKVINIGEMESVDYTPDYSKDELLNVVVELYTTNLRDNEK